MDYILPIFRKTWKLCIIMMCKIILLHPVNVEDFFESDSMESLIKPYTFVKFVIKFECTENSAHNLSARLSKHKYLLSRVNC